MNYQINNNLFFKRDLERKLLQIGIFGMKPISLFSTGFVAIEDSKYTSDVNWGCMLRSSQMLAAQVTFLLLFCLIVFILF